MQIILRSWTRNLPAHTNCNLADYANYLATNNSKLTCAYELQLCLLSDRPPYRASKLTCAYELQHSAVCRQATTEISKLTCAYELQPAPLAAFLDRNVLETYLRIRIATGVLMEPLTHLKTRNLPAHTNCNQRIL